MKVGGTDGESELGSDRSTPRGLVASRSEKSRLVKRTGDLMIGFRRGRSDRITRVDWPERCGRKRGTAENAHIYNGYARHSERTGLRESLTIGSGCPVWVEMAFLVLVFLIPRDLAGRASIRSAYWSASTLEWTCSDRQTPKIIRWVLPQLCARNRCVL